MHTYMHICIYICIYIYIHIHGKSSYLFPKDVPGTLPLARLG